MSRRGTPGRAPRTKATQSAAEAITRTLQFHGIADQVRGERVVTEWGELVGPRIAQRTRAAGITDGVLWIEVASSAWMQELNLLRPQLVLMLLERLGEPRLFETVKFRLAGRGRREAITVPGGRRGQVAAPPPPPIPATGAAREQIVREVAGVDDEELRELIARVRITHDR